MLYYLKLSILYAVQKLATFSKSWFNTSRDMETCDFRKMVQTIGEIGQFKIPYVLLGIYFM